jgi:hypothetical protein
LRRALRIVVHGVRFSLLIADAVTDIIKTPSTDGCPVQEPP